MPWLDFLFVDENYHQNGIAHEMISTVKAFAKASCFNELFLCTASHEDYYKKVGFDTVADVQINEYAPGKIMRIAL